VDPAARDSLLSRRLFESAKMVQAGDGLKAFALSQWKSLMFG
jgi:hypothetical protein